MSKCRDCKYAQVYQDLSVCCTLTRRVMNGQKEHNCSVINADLSKYDMCYNCKYYGGGGDWGLFCSHNEMYHHLGNFNDEPCEYYERKQDE